MQGRGVEEISMPQEQAQEHWFALKIFYNRAKEVIEKLQTAGIRHYQAVDAKGKPLIAGLVFVQTEKRRIEEFKRVNDNRLLIYQNADRQPAVISDREMDNFIKVTQAAAQGLVYIGEDSPKYHEGQRVRVLSGPYQGIEGYIKRIKKDRRLLVCVSGVAVLATGYVNPRDVEPVVD